MNPEANIKLEEPKVPEQKVETPAETAQEVNWKNFREQREQDRKAREAAEKIAQEERAKAEAMKNALEALVNKPVQHQEQHEESEEQRIARQVDLIIAQREAQARTERARKDQEELPQRLQETYSDFHQVVKPQNLDYLEFHYPELAEPFKHMPDGFAKWSAMYKAVKRFVPNVDAQKDGKKAEQNMMKPQGTPTTVAPSSGSSGPPVRLDEARRAANWERMQKALRGLT